MAAWVNSKYSLMHRYEIKNKKRFLIATSIIGFLSGLFTVLVVIR